MDKAPFKDNAMPRLVFGAIKALPLPSIAHFCQRSNTFFSKPVVQTTTWLTTTSCCSRKFNRAKFNEIGKNPNIRLGKRDDVTGKVFYNFAKKILDNGATILGGCCETSPSHIKAITKIK